MAEIAATKRHAATSTSVKRVSRSALLMAGRCYERRGDGSGDEVSGREAPRPVWIAAGALGLADLGAAVVAH
ncbi:MAG: hypothetical protein ABI555_02535 [Chloroflexota bacterium]